MTSKAKPKVLIADDQQDILLAGKIALEDQGFHVVTVKTPEEAEARVKAGDFNVVLLDMNYTKDTTSGQEGLDLLSAILGVDPDLPVVVMTAWANYELAVEAMRRGARDFVKKPWENERLASIVRNQADYYLSRRTGRRLEEQNRLLRKDSEVDFLARSEAMQPVLEIIERVGESDANILITGENGTGKGVVARLLHEQSHRSSGPFISVNLGGLPEGVFESELFGHVKGAFTDARADRMGRFELAEGGSLFLDEIGNVPLLQQSKLLRLLETGEFERVGSSKTLKANVRLISATNADIKEEVEAGHFREDLLYRLNTIPIHLPPLRARGDDIELLARHFLEKYNARYRKEIRGFTGDALKALNDYHWPGNVRELEHTLERSVLLCRGREIQAGDLGLEAGQSKIGDIDSMSLEEVEKYLIERTLKRCEGNVSEAARRLGMGRTTFYRRLKQYGL